MTFNGATNIMMLLAASSALSQTRTATEPAWWAPLKPLQTGLGWSAVPRKESSPVSQGTCPELPIPDAAFEMIPDGRCRTAVDGNPSDGQVTLAYRITCDAIGTTTVTYLWLASEDQPEACNEADGVNVTIPAAYCFGSPPLFQGSRFSCGASGNATLYGWTAQRPTFNQTNDLVVTRDGARLVTQTVFPPSAPFPPTGKTKRATMYVQTPYDANSPYSARIKAIPQLAEPVLKSVGLDFSLAVTLQQNRGLYASTGNFDNGNHTKTDAGETAAWILKQDWSNGVILTQGLSAMGMTALLAADASPPVPTRASWLSITTNDLREAFYREGLFRSGIFGVIVMPGFIQASKVPRAPLAEREGNAQGLPFWEPLKFDEFSKVSWPSVHRTGWFDMFLKGGLRAAQGYYEHARCGFGVFGCSSTLLVDALGHAGLQGVPNFTNCPLCFPYNKTAQGLVENFEMKLSTALLFVFQGATNDLIAAGLNVFWAAATKLLPQKIVYVLGSGGNYLTSFDQWPKPTSQTLYLAPDASLVWEQPAASAGFSVTYVYDPSDPAPTFGGWLFQNSNPNGEGSVDQALLRERSDVIHFDGAPLAAPLAICGAISATLAVGSTANDTDFIVRLVDQYPSGERYLVAEGVVRMRWRNETSTPLPMAAGAVYEVGVDMWSACWIFAAGHRIGIDVTSSSSFAYLPNPNTGLPLEPDGIWPQGGEVYKGKNVTATNSVHLGASAVTLPTVSASALPPMGPLPNILSLLPKSLPAEAELLRMGAEARRVGEHHVRMGRKEPLSFKHIRTVEEDAVPDSVEAVPWEQA